MPADKRPQRRSFDTSSIQVLGAAISGLILLAAILVFAMLAAEIRDRNFQIIWAVLSLSAAAYAAIIPGFIEIRYKTLVRAGGAIAVFVIMFFFVPQVTEDPPPIPLPPPEDARDEALSLLELIDEGKFDAAWEEMATSAQEKYPKELFRDLSHQFRTPKGEVIDRKFFGYSSGFQLPTGERGRYAFVEFRTRFENDERIFREGVTLETVNQKWKPILINFEACQPTTCGLS